MCARLTSRPKWRQTIATQAAPQSASSICQTCGKRRIRCLGASERRPSGAVPPRHLGLVDSRPGRGSPPGARRHRRQELLGEVERHAGALLVRRTPATRSLHAPAEVGVGSQQLVERVARERRSRRRSLTASTVALACAPRDQRPSPNTSPRRRNERSSRRLARHEARARPSRITKRARRVALADDRSRRRHRRPARAPRASAPSDSVVRRPNAASRAQKWRRWWSRTASRTSAQMPGLLRKSARNTAASRRSACTAPLARTVAARCVPSISSTKPKLSPVPSVSSGTSSPLSRALHRAGGAGDDHVEGVRLVALAHDHLAERVRDRLEARDHERAHLGGHELEDRDVRQDAVEAARRHDCSIPRHAT